MHHSPLHKTYQASHFAMRQYARLLLVGLVFNSVTSVGAEDQAGLKDLLAHRILDENQSMEEEQTYV